MASPDPTPAPDTLSTQPASTRPASAWPATAGPRTLPGGSFDPSRFNPLAEQFRRERQRLATQLDLCKPAQGLRVLLFIQIVVALAALPGSSGALEWAFRAIPAAFAALAAGLLWITLLCALGPLLPRWPRAARDGLAALLGAVCALVAWAMTALFALVEVQVWAALGTAACGAALGFGLWRWYALRAAAAQPVEASARLTELQSRIRPHFLFNALNTAIALVQVDPVRAESVLEDLSQLFRAALAETGSAVTLDEEIELAQRYLAIEKLRFGSRLQLLWDLDPAAAQARVPPLVLQPLVENAVRHGIEPALRGGQVQVRTRVVRGMAEVQVTNTLPEGPGKPGSGIALANVRERLRLLHDVAASLDVGTEGGQFQARITIPL